MPMKPSNIQKVEYSGPALENLQEAVMESLGKGGDRINAFDVHSHSLVFNLPINPPKLSVSSLTRASSISAKSFITHWNFHPCCVIGLGLPNQLHLMILHTHIISNSEAAKGSCVSSQTAKNSQTNASNLTADNTEGNLLTGKKKSILSHTGSTVIPQGCEAPALSAGVKKLVKVARSPGLHLGGTSHCPWCWKNKQTKKKKHSKHHFF